MFMQPNPGLKHVGGQWARAMVLVMSVAAGVPMAWAQGAASSTIHGAATDETGAAMPGVTVTLTSPQLQAKERVTVTEGDGTYRFTELPAGTYRLAFVLPGFRTFVRDELRITIGFTARVDAKMGVGGIEESVTVSGQSPVVDLDIDLDERDVHQRDSRGDSARPGHAVGRRDGPRGHSRRGARRRRQPDGSASCHVDLRSRSNAEDSGRGDQHRDRLGREHGGLLQLRGHGGDPDGDLGHECRGGHAGAPHDCRPQIRWQPVPRPVQGSYQGKQTQGDNLTAGVDRAGDR